MDRQRAHPNGTYVGPSVLDGIPRIFSHRRLAKYGLFATSGTPLTTVRGRVESRQTFQLVAAAAGILAIVAAATAIIIFNRRRHRRLVALEDANNRLTEAQRIGSIGDWDYYPATDHLYWSENLCAMYGRDPDEEQVSSLADVQRHLSPADAAMVEREVRKVLEDGETVSWEFEGILADGSRSHRRVIAVPIRNDEGNVVGIHGTDQDVSHLVQAREMERRLSEIARLESVNSLAATLAHELNQPLGITANYLSAVQRMIDEDGSRAKIKEYLAASQDQVHHLSAIIDGARDLVTPGKIDVERVDIQDAIESVMILLRGHAGHRAVNYEVDLAANVAKVWTNGAQLKQILFNLAKNSLEAIPPDREPRVSFRARRSDDRTALRIDVRDNGTGLDGTDDPFGALNTTKETGLGLGLSLARTIVEAHGGKIWIDSSDTDGTTVSFTLGELR
jgi:signal transduction histidine kinase